MARFFILILCLCFPAVSFAATSELHHMDLTEHWVGISALVIFVCGYTLVILEDKLHLRKSKPMLMAAGLIWILIALVYVNAGDSESVKTAIQHNFLDYAELFFFLLVAMTYINAMIERDVFDVLRDYLVKQKMSYRALFWLTGILAFFISALADNLTTALIMCAVIMSVGRDQPKFIAIGCVNVVVAANAGGAFSPFGDITTLMVWQHGILPFATFLKLFVPSVVNYVVPACVMTLAVPAKSPEPLSGELVRVKTGGLVIVGLFLLTIFTAVCFQNFLFLPPIFGMMVGLAYLKIFSYYLLRRKNNRVDKSDNPTSHVVEEDFDIFDKIAKAEWDTLFFFYGVIMSVGGLGFIGYLSLVSAAMYGDLGATQANILVGLLSAVVDNIPVMFAVLNMQPDMDQVQWLLVTLTAGVGGSLLSIGSAAGVALMGQARGKYTFFSHLKWTPVIALGYGASIWVHFLING
jgi:NhaD family Na+/H+ antiporter